MKSFKEFRIKELILHNFPLKILAIIIAIVSWIVIINVDNPSQRKTISGITVNLVNGEALTSKGYIYQVESGTNISVVVKAPQTVVDELKASDFYAYADLGERTPDSNRAQIYVSCIKEGTENTVDIVSLKTEYVQLSIDNRIDKECELELDITGQPADGYVIGDYSISPTTIKVSGAENTVSRIASAKLTYNVSSMTAGIDDSVVPVFYDEFGLEINSDKLELSRNNARIKIDILPTKWVRINYAVSGEPAEGYTLVEQNANMESVNIAASKDLLDKINAIDIPAGTVDITDAVEDKTFEIPLMTYLPAGYRIVSSENTLKVDFSIVGIAERMITFPISEINVDGMSDDYEYQIMSDVGSNSISVKVSGVEEDISSLNASDLGASISLSGKKAGSYTVRVNFNASDVYDISEAYYVKVLINEKNVPTEPETTIEETETETETEEPEETVTVPEEE